MEKEREFKLNVGASSIILIIAVFALSIFAVLSVKASNSDLVLAKRTKEAIQAYYDADAKAEHVLMKIDQVLNNYYADMSGVALKVQLQSIVEDSGQVEAQSDKVGKIAYQIKINENAFLEVEIRYNIETGTNQYYDITKWKVNQSEIGEYDFSNFTFWDGTINED